MKYCLFVIFFLLSLLKQTPADSIIHEIGSEYSINQNLDKQEIDEVLVTTEEKKDTIPKVEKHIDDDLNDVKNGQSVKIEEINDTDKKTKAILSRIHGARNWIDETSNHFQKLHQQSLDEQKELMTQKNILETENIQNRNEISYLKTIVHSLRQLFLPNNKKKHIFNRYIKNEKNCEREDYQDDDFLITNIIEENEKLYQNQNQEDEENNVDCDMKEHLSFLSMPSTQSISQSISSQSISQSFASPGSSSALWPSLYQFLSHYGLEQYETNMVRNGITSISFLRYPSSLEMILNTDFNIDILLHSQMLISSIKHIRLAQLHVCIYQATDLPNKRGFFNRIRRQQQQSSVHVFWQSETRQTPIALGSNPKYGDKNGTHLVFRPLDISHFSGFLGIDNPTPSTPSISSTSSSHNSSHRDKENDSLILFRIFDHQLKHRSDKKQQKNEDEVDRSIDFGRKNGQKATLCDFTIDISHFGFYNSHQFQLSSDSSSDCSDSLLLVKPWLEWAS